MYCTIKFHSFDQFVIITKVNSFLRYRHVELQTELAIDHFQIARVIMRFWYLLLCFAFVVVHCVSLKGHEVEKGSTRLRRPRSVDSQVIYEWRMQDVLSFSDDNDNKADRIGEYTSASIEKENLPMSFTICAAFMVEAWNTDFISALILSILGDNKFSVWGGLMITASNTFTEY